MQNRAVVVEKTDKSFSCTVKNIDVPNLGEDDVLVEVSYSSLNYKDALSSVGNPGVSRNFPHVTGIDAAGVVVESNNATFKKGERVFVTGYDFGMNTKGGHQNFVSVPAKWLLHTPENISDKTLMQYGTAGLTAALSIVELTKNGVKPEDGAVLVTGATGGVGSVAVAILAKLGYEVIALSGKADKEAFLKKLGAKEMLLRAELEEANKRPLLSTRWAGIVDCVGGTILAEALKSLSYEGVATCCGLTASAELPTNVFPFILRGCRLIGIDSAESPLQKRNTAWQKLANEYAVEELMEELSTQISLEEVPQHYKNFLAASVSGRVVVKVSK